MAFLLVMNPERNHMVGGVIWIIAGIGFIVAAFDRNPRIRNGPYITSPSGRLSFRLAAAVLGCLGIWAGIVQLHQ
jgi:hypothetical protein